MEVLDTNQFYILLHIFLTTDQHEFRIKKKKGNEHAMQIQITILISFITDKHI